MAQISCTAVAASVCSIAAWMNLTCRDRMMDKGYAIPYGDTDSTACCMGAPRAGMSKTELFAYFYERASELEHELSMLFPKPNYFEAESLKMPHIIPSEKKKSYAGIEHANDTKNKSWKSPGKETIKGLTMIKRDRCKYVQVAGIELLRAVLHGASNESIANTGSAAINTFTNADVRTMDDLLPFIITSSFTGEYKTATALGLVLSKMIIDETGKAPMVGSRIPYVIVQRADAAKVVDRLSTVTAFLRESKKLDARFYLQNQLTNVYKQVLQLPQHVEVYAYLLKASELRISQLSSESHRLC
jgi:DNA polymerase elongation subunit (family B)